MVRIVGLVFARICLKCSLSSMLGLLAHMMELVDMVDSKSAGLMAVRVRLPL